MFFFWIHYAGLRSMWALGLCKPGPWPCVCCRRPQSVPVSPPTTVRPLTFLTERDYCAYHDAVERAAYTHSVSNKHGNGGRWRNEESVWPNQT
ncbi:hypothetical protein BJ166DRAFT_5637 [Pestalotiopsis sp. NC0098]|nr:hypothetical protein BJ166DRAFT_5637 [Pestalotiopsis sp. NC0098]